MKETGSHKKIFPYQESWQQIFDEEKENLEKIFGSKALAIEHIGSTSIPGLSSKNIIDIVVLIDHIDNADKFINDLEKIGYVHDTRGVSTERHFFRKYGEYNFHISIAYKSRGSFYKRQILFRNFLREHNKYRDEYQKLKDNLIKQDPEGGDNYISGKTEFIEKVLRLANFGDESYKWNDKN
jgi:GrpB-like predicted nucleotidyltransferase (UPF0157 family)